MKTKLTFQINNSNIAPMDDKEKLTKFGECFGFSGNDIEQINVHVLETDDVVTISQPFGGNMDKDGVTHNSKIREITGIYRADNDLCGSIYTHDGNHIQAIDSIVENNYLNPRIN